VYFASLEHWLVWGTVVGAHHNSSASILKSQIVPLQGSGHSLVLVMKAAVPQS
jgi:hypothetical protein